MAILPFALTEITPAGKTLAEMEPQDFLSEQEMVLAYRSQYVTPDGEVLSSSRFNPSVFVPPPVGSWRIDHSSQNWNKYGRIIEKLMFIPVSEVVVSEDNSGKGNDVERYTEWLREGKQPPPLRAAYLQNGRFKIGDGHRRLEAHQRAGKTEILAWVAFWADTGRKTAEGKLLETDLTFELLQELKIKNQ